MKKCIGLWPLVWVSLFASIAWYNVEALEVDKITDKEKSESFNKGYLLGTCAMIELHTSTTFEECEKDFDKVKKNLIRKIAYADNGRMLKFKRKDKVL